MTVKTRGLAKSWLPSPGKSRLFSPGRVRDRVLPLLAAGLLGLLAVCVVLAPAEAQLGQLIKLVYVHGALVMVGLGAFSLAGGLGLVALVVRRRIWYNGTWAAGLAALIVWIVYSLSSMAVTGLTWGQVIAWNEPRVRASALILLAAVVLAIVTRLVGHHDLTALVNLVMGIMPWILVRRAEAIRHPLDPIGGSQSTSIQLFFGLIIVAVAGLALVLIAWLWLGAMSRPLSPGEQRGEE